jgi:hypothetical protein
MAEAMKLRDLPAIRERDEMWCRALIATLDPRDVQRVLEVFNANRSD